MPAGKPTLQPTFGRCGGCHGGQWGGEEGGALGLTQGPQLLRSRAAGEGAGEGPRRALHNGPTQLLPTPREVDSLPALQRQSVPKERMVPRACRVSITGSSPSKDVYVESRAMVHGG